MGLPKDKLLEIMFTQLSCYQNMREHYLEFARRWFDELFIPGNDEYLSSRPFKVEEEDLLKSFDYVKSLPENPSAENIIELAKSVLEGCLAYSASDDCNDSGFKMEDCAAFILGKMRPSQ